jgi:tyrosyl-tRNA synthetase
MKTALEILEERGFIADCTDSNTLHDRLSKEKMTIYIGFDPTAESLHLGHLVPIIALSHMQKAGVRVLMIVGGATGMVGDPSGKSDERNLLMPDDVAKNVEGVKAQMGRFLDFTGDNAATILDNNEWISKMSFIDWLREVGKYFTVNYMLAKESVKKRLGDSESGISYTELSYMTMQAYDFLYLFDNYNCTLQGGGSDQWGNITAGIDLIRKLRQSSAYGLTFHLITTATGEKFGKTAGNAVWLDKSLTSSWDFYQYLVRTDDRDVIRFLKLYTFLTINEIDKLEQSMTTVPEKREAQKALAFEVTRIVHGEDTAQEMTRAAEVVYGTEIKNVSDETLSSVFAGVPSSELRYTELEAGIELIGLFVKTGMVKSRSETMRLLKSGGIYVNNVRVADNINIGRKHLASESFIILRTGKKNYHLVSVK